MLLVGHRGARGEAPENTLEGFAYLRQLGINAVELDIQLSQDNQLMVIHDTQLDRTTSGTGAVAQWNAAEMAELTPTVPTLSQVLAPCPELAHLQIELKTIAADRRQALIEGLRQTLVEEFPHHSGQLIITSSDTQLLALTKQRLPHIPRGLVAQRFCRNPIQLCEALDCEFLILNHQRCFLSTLRQAQYRGLHVSCWTVNSPAIAQRLLRWGLDSLITDYPLKMLEHFGGSPV